MFAREIMTKRVCTFSHCFHFMTQSPTLSCGLKGIAHRTGAQVVWSEQGHLAASGGRKNPCVAVDGSEIRPFTS